MTRSALPAVLLALASLAATGCKSKTAKTCDKYVDIAMRCDKDKLTEGMTDEETSQARGILYGICTEAFHGDTEGAKGEAKQMVLEMYDHITKAAECEAQATTCEERQRCEDKLKPTLR